MGLRNTFSTILTDIARNETVNVESLNVFNSIRVGKVITLVGDVAYNITKKFSWEDVEFVLDPDARITFSTSNTVANGINTEILPGRSLFSGALNRIDFIGTDIVSANGGQLFNLTAGNTFLPALFLSKSRVQGFDKVATLNGVSVALENIAHILNAEGWDIIDASILQIAEQNIVASQGTTYKMSGTTGSLFYDTIESNPFVVDTTFDISGTVNSAFFNTIKVKPTSGGAVFNIDSSLIVTNAFQIIGGSVDKSAGGVMFKAGSLDQTDPKIIVDNVSGCPSSQWIASTGFTGNATATILADTVTPVQIAGTYVSGELERFTEEDGVLTYIGLEPISFPIQPFANIVLEPGIETDVIRISAYKNGAEVTGTRSQQQLDAVFQTPTSPFFGRATHIPLETGDTLDIRMLNTSFATNMVATDANIIVGK